MADPGARDRPLAVDRMIRVNRLIRLKGFSHLRVAIAELSSTTSTSSSDNPANDRQAATSAQLSHTPHSWPVCRSMTW